MTAGSGPAAPSLRASLRLFRLAMSAQRQQQHAATAATAATAPAAAPTATATIARPAAFFSSSSSSSSAIQAAPRPWAVWRPAGAVGTGLLQLPATMAARAGLPPPPSFSSARAFAAATTTMAITSVRLNDLHPALGATKAVRRVGRGDGSGRGKTCGRGTKGQGSRKGNGKPGLLFDGGTRQLRKFPKVHARPGSPVEYDYVNVADVAAAARAGLLGGIDFSSSAGTANANASADNTANLPLVTMKHLRDAGLVSKSIRWGVKLLARAEEEAELGAPTGASSLPPMRLQVSAASAAARRVVERAGGCVEAVYYNRLGLRALLKPEAWEREGRPLPRGVRAWPPRDEGRFDAVGALPPRPAAGGGSGAAAGAGGV